MNLETLSSILADPNARDLVCCGLPLLMLVVGLYLVVESSMRKAEEIERANYLTAVGDVITDDKRKERGLAAKPVSGRVIENGD